MKKSIIGLLWGESTLKVMAILYDEVISYIFAQFPIKYLFNIFTGDNWKNIRYKRKLLS